MSNSNGVRNGTEKNPYTSSPYTKIGERIGQLRKQAGLKQEELGRAVGVTTQAVSRWECGGAPDIELLPAIADTLHVSVDELFGRTPVAQTDIKELFDRTLYSYPKKDRMKAACDLMWNIQKAVLRCEGFAVFDEHMSIAVDPRIDSMPLAGKITLSMVRARKNENPLIRLLGQVMSQPMEAEAT